MNKITSSLVGFLASQLIAVPALAVTPDIAKQQQKYQQMKATWEKARVPAGLEQQALRDKTLRDSGHEGTTLYINNVNFDVVENIGFYVKELAVTLEPVTSGNPAAFDLVEEFTINIHHGEVTLSPESVNALFNKHILDYSGAPLDEIDVSPDTDYLETSTWLRLWGWFPGLWLPASLGGEIVIDEETNDMVYDLDDVRALGIPLAGLLKLIHVPLTWLLSVDRPGAQLHDYSLALDHNTVFPAPAIGGTVEKAWLDKEGLHLRFNNNPDVKFDEPPVASKSYLWAQSGDPKLYGVVVTNAGVQVISNDESTPLRFNLYDYRRQVAKGILKMTPTGDIIATIPSYETLEAKK